MHWNFKTELNKTSVASSLYEGNIKKQQEKIQPDIEQHVHEEQ